MVVSVYSKRSTPAHDPLGLVRDLPHLKTFPEELDHGHPDMEVTCAWTGKKTKQWIRWFDSTGTRMFVLDKDFVLQWMFPAWIFVHFLRWCIQQPHKSWQDMKADFDLFKTVWE
jgi:hypothetical protein